MFCQQEPCSGFLVTAAFQGSPIALQQMTLQPFLGSLLPAAGQHPIGKLHSDWMSLFSKASRTNHHKNVLHEKRKDTYQFEQCSIVDQARIPASGSDSGINDTDCRCPSMSLVIAKTRLNNLFWPLTNSSPSICGYCK